MRSENLYKVTEMPSLYLDAYAINESGNLIFGSFWGTDIVIKEFFARLTLPNQEGGLREFTINLGSNHVAKRITVVEVNEMQKKTQVTPTNTIAGSLVHTWIFDPKVVKQDNASRRAYTISSVNEDSNTIDQKNWETVKQLLHLPVLEIWRQPLVKLFIEKGWLKEVDSLGVISWHIDLSDIEELERLINQMLIAGMLKAGEGDDRQPLEPFFTQEDLIHCYTRAEAIEDGFLVDVSEIAGEAGIRFHTVLTRDVWEDCVAWDEVDDNRKPSFTGQDEQGRLWDIVHMLAITLRALINRDIDRIGFKVLRVPREGKGVKPKTVQLQAQVGPGDEGEPVITIEHHSSQISKGGL